ncbi:MAG: hypothetical protein J1F66_05045 [Clostridiales bacterium]|nr:hypothetical protein [Clostridiales bacterium]
MINKLRANYNLSNVLIRIFLVLAYVLYSWQTSLAVTTLMLERMVGGYNLWLALLTSALLGAIIMVIVPFISNIFLNYSHFYTVPRAEYGLLTMLFIALYFAICGLLKLINLITPILLVWGEILFPVLVSLGCVIWFYSVTANLYFNNQTKPYYFRNIAITYLVLIIVAEVLL